MSKIVLPLLDPKKPPHMHMHMYPANETLPILQPKVLTGIEIVGKNISFNHFERN